MLTPGLPIGIQTLKAAVLTEDRKRVEPIIDAMISTGEITKIKKDRYIKKEK